MSVTWRGVPCPQPRPLVGAERLRVTRRLALLALVIAGALLALLVVKGIERPLHGDRRPWTPKVRRAASQAMLAVLGVHWRVRGQPLQGVGAQAANHSGWLDILTLAAASEVTFVSKSEVRRWPVIGWIAAICGTVFISRRRGDAAAQQAALVERLAAGETLVFFPEGTSTDGRRVLPFRSTLFAAFWAPGLEAARIQPVTLAYRAPEGERADFYGWWADMELAPHLVEVMAMSRQGEVEIIFHKPLLVRDHPDRKALAARCEATVRDGLHRRIGSPDALSAAAQ